MKLSLRGISTHDTMAIATGKATSLVYTGESPALDEKLHVLVSLVSILPGQSSEHDLLEKVIDPLHSFCREARLMPMGVFVSPHVRLSHFYLFPFVQRRPLFVRYLRLHRLVDRIQHVTQRDRR